MTSTVVGPTPAESFGLPPRATSGFLLPNVRSVDLALDLTNPGRDAWNACAADNLSLVLRLESVTGANLVVNGDAETAPGKDGSFGAQLPVIGWNAVDSAPYLMAVSYQDEEIEASASGPEKREHLLVSSSGGTIRAGQTIDVTVAKDLIDGGGVRHNLSAWLGGVDDDAGLPSLTADFLDGSGKTLASETLGPVRQGDRGGKTGLLLKSVDGTVPAGTRALRVTLELANGNPVGAGQFADNISLTLTSPSAGVNLVEITNAASGKSGAIAPGEIVVLATTGINLSSTARMQLATDGTIARELAGVKVYFGGTQTPLWYVSSSQIGAFVRFDIEGKSSIDVRVEYQGVKSNTVTQSVAKTAPGIFTQDGAAKGLGLIYNGGTVLNSKTNPAAMGATVTLYWTGRGQTNPPGVDGRIEMGALPVPVQAVSVTIGGKAAEVVFAGAVPYGWAGLLQATVKTPSGLSATEGAPVVLKAGDVASPDNAVTMWVK